MSVNLYAQILPGLETIPLRCAYDTQFQRVFAHLNNRLRFCISSSEGLKAHGIQRFPTSKIEDFPHFLLSKKEEGEEAKKVPKGSQTDYVSNQTSEVPPEARTFERN